MENSDHRINPEDFDDDENDYTVRQIYPWIAVNGYMNDDFRAQMLKDAWHHLPQASKGLQRWARESIQPNLRVKGYRPKSAMRAAFTVVYPALQEAMMGSAVSAAALICLWAEAHQRDVQRLREAAVDAGLMFHAAWTWENGRIGFCAPEEVEALDALVDGMAEDEADRSRLALAVLWLSTALTDRVEDTIPVEQAAPPPEPEPLPVEAPPAPLETPTPEAPIDTPLFHDPEPSALPTPPIAPSIEIDLSPLPDLNLSVVYEALETTLQAYEGAYGGLRAHIEDLSRAIGRGRVADAERFTANLPTLLGQWRLSRGQLAEIAQSAAAFLGEELAERPDLAARTGLPERELAPDDAVRELMELSHMVVEYDQRKEKASRQLRETITEITGIQLEIDVLSDEAERAESLLMPDLGLSDRYEEDVTLSEVQRTLSQTRELQDQLSSRLSQLRGARVGAVREQITRLVEMEVSLKTPVAAADGLTLAQLDQRIESLPSAALKPIEAELAEQIAERLREQEPASLEGLRDLLGGWDAALLEESADALARTKRDNAVFLLLFLAVMQPGAGPLHLRPAVIDSLLRSLEPLSGGQPFHLLNLVAPLLINDWHIDDPTAQARLCMALLAADYTPRQRLSERFLWTLNIPQWPLHEMPHWSALWELALSEEYLPPLTSEHAFEQVTEARAAAETLLLPESGAYPRVHTVKSARHVTLLNEHLMPDLAAYLETLTGFEDQLRAGARDAQFAEEIAEMRDVIAADIGDLEAIYDSAASSEGVNDQNPFHRRTSIKLLRDCCEALLAYAESLLEFVAQQQNTAQITPGALFEDMAGRPDLLGLAQQVIAHLDSVADRASLPPWDYDYAMRDALRLLVEGLLRQPEAPLRMPRLISELVARDLELIDWFPYFVEDMAEPLTEAEAVALLLERGATAQTLHVITQLPTDLQKQVQALNAENLRKAATLTDELERMGGSADDLDADREAGRWGRVISQLEARVEARRVARSSQQRGQREQAGELLAAANAIDTLLFQHQGSIPFDVHALVRQGLDIVRRSIFELRLFDEIEEFLGDIRYRIEHVSWPLLEMQAHISLLEERYAGRETPRIERLDSGQVFDLLERRELRALGLGEDELIPSEISTRLDLLDHWQRVRAIPELMTDQLNAAERDAVQRLSQSFRQMVQLAFVHDRQTDEPMDYDQPVIHSFRRLMYPKTSALDVPIVLLTLPGTPPRAVNVREIETLIEDRGWLESFFVLLFVPGCTEQLRNRFLSNFREKGLVVIDDETLVSIVLAERSGVKPLGRLRSLMLNSKPAENVDIFKINQSVDSQRSIFVGRESLVDRISSSGENHALYGGRRIGKSSILDAVGDRLRSRDNQVVKFSFEGRMKCTDSLTALWLASLLDPGTTVRTVEDFESMMRQRLEQNPAARITFLLDEIDVYIRSNQHRHLMIETMRKLSDHFKGRLRVIVAGFMSLYDVLKGAGPYDPGTGSDPWHRMFIPNNVSNLTSASAERIVKEGFREILGWHFETHTIPRRVVEYTGGHPAFVQKFCSNLRDYAGQRRDMMVRLDDVEAVFADQDPHRSFIAYVQDTLKYNLDPVGRYITVWLAQDAGNTHGFTLAQMRDYADTCRTAIPDDRLRRSLERLEATSVVRQRQPGLYEFSVPDYPKILERLGDTRLLENLEAEIEHELAQVES